MPDFTFQYNGQTWYWEHLGLLGDDRYESHWRKKEKWYKDNGFFEYLIVTDEQNGVDAVKWQQCLYEKIGKQ